LGTFAVYDCVFDSGAPYDTDIFDGTGGNAWNRNVAIGRFAQHDKWTFTHPEASPAWLTAPVYDRESLAHNRPDYGGWFDSSSEDGPGGLGVVAIVGIVVAVVVVVALVAIGLFCVLRSKPAEGDGLA
jgi:hypothetical protein